MNATVEQNNPKIFSNNVNSKGMVAPPVPPRSPETKLSSQSKLQDVKKPEVASSVPPELKKFDEKLEMFKQKEKDALNQAGSPNADGAASTPKKFKYEVKQSGNLYLRWNTPTGNSLNELNAKKASPATPKLTPMRELREKSDSVSSSSSISTQSTTPSAQETAEKEIASAAPKPHVDVMEEAHELNPMRELRERSESVSSSSSISTQSTASSATAEKEIASAAPKPHVDVMEEAHELNPMRELRERSESVSSSSSISTQSTASSATAEKEIASAAPKPHVDVMEETHELNPMRELREKSESVSSSSSISTQSTASSEQATSEAPKIEKQVHSNIPEQTAKSPTSDNPLDHNPIYKGKRRVSERFKLRPLLCSDIDGYVTPDKCNPDLEKCSITRSGATLKPLKRNHGFKEDPTIKHVKGEIATCAVTRGKGEKGATQPYAPHKQEPPSEFSEVNVRKLADKFRGQ